MTFKLVYNGKGLKYLYIPIRRHITIAWSLTLVPAISPYLRGACYLAHSAFIFEIVKHRKKYNFYKYY